MEGSQSPDFQALARKRDLSWDDVCGINWSAVQVTPGDPSADSDARTVAGKARDFAEFYAPENYAVAVEVERYLTRYSAAHSRV